VETDIAPEPYADTRAALLTRDMLARQAIVTMSLQIHDRLRARIEGGDYPPGTRLPSAKVLAERYVVHPSTVSRALRMLVAEGHAVYRPGLGHFAAG